VQTWSIVAWTAAVVGCLGLLYGLHLLALRLEERGHLYYLHKKPTGNAAGSFVALQRIMEPQVEHVVVVRNSGKLIEKGQIPGGKEPPTP
jgi:uncharacterized membrane protein YiaA